MRRDSSYTARRLPQHAGPAAWNAILPPVPPLPPLAGDRVADFAIIGAGFAGLSAARRLVQLNPGASIAVLDAGRIGEGAAGRNSGFMIDLPHELTSEDYAGADGSSDRSLIALNRQAIAFAREAAAEYAIDANYLDPAGKTNGAASESSHARNQSYAAHLDQLGEACELLDAQAMFELTGSRHYLSGLYTPGTLMLQPAGYVRGLATGLLHSTGGRVAIYENSPVTALARQGTSWRLETAAGSVSCGRAIFANNGQVESFGVARGRLMHLFLFARMTEELSDDALRQLGGQPRWGVTPADPMGTTVRRIDTGQGGNRIIVRSCAEYCPQMRSSAGKLQRSVGVMRGKFDERFPALRNVRMQYSWSGHLCLSQNGVSLAGEIDSGLFTACCQNGLGTARGTLTGIAAAELASGQRSAISDFFAAQPQPTRLPPAPLAKLGATAYLNWKEWRARHE